MDLDPDPRDQFIVRIHRIRIQNSGFHPREQRDKMPESQSTHIVRVPVPVLWAVLRIRYILVRIPIRGSLPLTNESGSCYIRQ
jgi:hypothetical protein